MRIIVSLWRLRLRAGGFVVFGAVEAVDIAGFEQPKSNIATRAAAANVPPC
jgi:hypothetical protein